MDPKYEHELAAEIDRELKALPELQAPATLVPRVLATLAARATAPRRRQLWQSWPWGLRVASLLSLLALFGGLCFTVSALSQVAPVATRLQACRSWFTGAAALYESLMALPGLLATLLKQVDGRLLLAAMAAIGLAYVVCVALAACSLRLGLTRTRNEVL